MRKLLLWGNHLDDYQSMFDLSAANLFGHILEYGCGPTAVNSQLTWSGHRIDSFDPLFNLDKEHIIPRVESIFETMVARLHSNQEHFDFSSFGGIDALIAQRRQGLNEFFADYEQGQEESRYQALVDYRIPRDDFYFDLALSANYLFADLDDQDVNFHLQVIKEMARVAKEVRIFPLVDRNGQPSPFLGPVLLGLQEENYGIEIKKINYSLQSGANAMLRVWAQQCMI